MTTADIEEIKSLLGRRDGWIEHYQRVELQISSQMGQFHRRVQELEHRNRELGGGKKAIARSVKRRVNRLLGRV
jgi:hypothetical protein